MTEVHKNDADASEAAGVGTTATTAAAPRPGAAVRRPLRLDRERSLRGEVWTSLGIDVDRCLECGKCSGGCSTGHLFDYTPRKIVQLVKLGAADVLESMDALSLCVGCQLCRDRCPAHIDVATIVDHFRQAAYEQGIAVSRPDVQTFNLLFLEGIFARGRTAELPLMLRFNLKRRRYLDDAELGWRLLMKGKLRLFASGVRDRTAVRRLFGIGGAPITRDTPEQVRQP
jgi:heterodisulfide reductase subunit C